ncbi:MAG: TolC family protein [Endomicrobiia bacterium]|nr:TolC family protein [Endomicrobiaceae bacterium]MDD3053268.1 TolC family protein [Endomicrobiaceae bacterium]MDD3922371.1 TolC family protein [Endomicrobiaceae bacterium]
MVKIRIIWLMLFFIVSPLFAEQAERVLTEDACINLALNINHDILIYGQNVLFAEQRVKEAKTLYLPTMDLNLNASKFSNDSPTIINSNSLPASFFLPAGNRDSSYSARVSLWQSIYNGGKTSAINELAKIYLSQVQNNSNIKKNEIITKVKINFYKSLSLKEKINAYKKEIERLSKYKNQKYIDEIEHLQNQLDIVQHQYEIQILDFISLMGLSLDTTVDLIGNMKVVKIDLNLQQCVLWSYQFRPEMKGTQYQESIDGIAVNLLTMEKYPTVMLGASYDWMGSEVDSTEKDWYITLNINYPIFDGGAIFTKIKQKQIKARQATLERSKSEEKIKLEVRKAFTEYSFWYNQVLNNKNVNRNIQNIEKEISQIDIQYNYLESLFNLELSIGKQISDSNLKTLE